MLTECRATEKFIPKIERCLEFCGFLPVSGRDGVSFLLRRYLLHAIRTLFVAQAALIPVASWKAWDLELRVVWMEEFSCELPALTYSLNFFHSNTNAEAVMRLIRPTFFDDTENEVYSTKLTEEESTLVEQEDTNNFYLLVTAEFFFNLVISSYLIKPLIRIALFCLGVKSLDAAAVPVMCFNPFQNSLTCDVTEVSHVIILSLLQVVYLYDVAMASHATHESLFFSIGNIVTDMKVLQLELRRMRNYLEQLMNEQLLRIEEFQINDVFSRNELEKLHNIAGKVCRHHQAVFRKVKEINRIFAFPILIVNGYCCIYVCLGVYCVVKGEFTSIITHCLPTLMVIFFCYILCQNGQRIENEAENLQLALYDSYLGFRGVPLWYQKYLLMLMLRHNRSPNLGPFRIFSLNRNNFKVVIQGAMSYFNILNNLAE